MAAKKKQKFYTVWEGRKIGVFNTWAECEQQIKGFEGAKYKSFNSRQAAAEALNGNYWNYVGNNKKVDSALSKTQLAKIGDPIEDSISVDAASSGNPGKMEYQGVMTKTGELIFHRGPFTEGTNNIGEFLALVHGLAYLQKSNQNLPIYTDSKIALGWVKKKKCGTKLKVNSTNQDVFELIERAETWLKENDFAQEIIKWETKAWGEIPADFGRK